MSAAWSVLIIVAGGIVAAVVYLVNPGREHLRGAERLVEDMRRERAAVPDDDELDEAPAWGPFGRLLDAQNDRLAQEWGRP